MKCDVTSRSYHTHIATSPLFSSFSSYQLCITTVLSVSSPCNLSLCPSHVSLHPPSHATYINPNKNFNRAIESYERAIRLPPNQLDFPDASREAQAMSVYKPALKLCQQTLFGPNYTSPMRRKMLCPPANRTSPAYPRDSTVPKPASPLEGISAPFFPNLAELANDEL